jgi:hypothetical protein
MMGTLLTTGGTMMIAQGSSPSPPNYPLIAAGVVLVGMGMMSFKQSKADKKAANAAGLTGNLSDAYDDTYSNTGGLDTSAETVAENNAIQGLEKAGIYNPKTGKITAGGKSYKASDFASKDSMAAAGIPAGAISGAMAYAQKEGAKIAAKENEKVKLGALTTANGYEEGSSAGGGGGAGAYPGTAADSYGGAGAGAGSGSASREPTNLAGMQKNYNGEPIGVSADSIFNMMARRYKVKDSQESFYSDTDLALKK